MNTKNTLEELSYYWITKENPFFIDNKFSKPTNKNSIQPENTLNIKNLYINKFNTFKHKSLTFLKSVRNCIDNEDLEELIRVLSIKLLKGIRTNVTFFFKFDVNLVYQIFKTILYYLVKGIQISEFNEDLILGKVNERYKDSNIEKKFIINKILQIIYK